MIHRNKPFISLPHASSYQGFPLSSSSVHNSPRPPVFYLHYILSSFLAPLLLNDALWVQKEYTKHTTRVGSHYKLSRKKQTSKPLTVDLKHSKHCESACKNFEYNTQGVMLSLCNSLVRSQLEDTAQFWSPNYKDVELLKKTTRCHNSDSTIVEG